MQIVDLDGDGLARHCAIADKRTPCAGSGRDHRAGVFTERIIEEEIPAPCPRAGRGRQRPGAGWTCWSPAWSRSPLTTTGSARWLFSKISTVAAFPATRVLVDHVARVTDVRAADLAGHKDGRLDLVGRSIWLCPGRNPLDGKQGRHLAVPSHVVSAQSGCIHTPVADFDGDGAAGFCRADFPGMGGSPLVS